MAQLEGFILLLPQNPYQDIKMLFQFSSKKMKNALHPAAEDHEGWAVYSDEDINL